MQIFYGEIRELILEALAIGKSILRTPYCSSQPNVTESVDIIIGQFLEKFFFR
jgi:hypothetical protein